MTEKGNRFTGGRDAQGPPHSLQATVPRGRSFQRDQRRSDYSVRKQHRVKARRPRRGYARLQLTCRPQTRSGQLSGLREIILPVVIRD